MEFTPTEEQEAAVAMALTGRSMAIEALAGTGKTATLELIAQAKPAHETGLYMAFNKAIVKDAEAKFPATVSCRTAHSLALSNTPPAFKDRCFSHQARKKGAEIAAILGIDSIQFDTEFGSKRLAKGFLASMVTKGINRFCQTADEKPRWWHIPTPDTMQADPALLSVWKEVQAELEPALQDAWADLTSERGRLNYSHGHYLKMWQLGTLDDDGERSLPRIEKDFILFDEAQDANPVMLSIVEAQREHAQLIFVGDRHQQIYSWNGAVNAMETAPVDGRTYLTNSFRFGPEIAGKANEILAPMGDVQIVGRGKAGRVGPIAEPDIILSRTNAVAVRRAMNEIEAGGKPHIVGGAGDVVSFAKGAKTLTEDGWTSHPDLVCFETWTEVQAYVREDELGADLKLLVTLIDDYGCDRIISTFNRQPSEKDATLILSTAHKSKGRQWDRVQLADDFPSDPQKLVGEERRLLYVASTRAMIELDAESVGGLKPPAEDEDDDEPGECDRCGEIGSDLTEGVCAGCLADVVAAEAASVLP